LLVSAVSIVNALQANVVELPCDVKILERHDIKNMVPAKITPKNFSHLILTLQVCGIEKAQVAGWNGYKGNMVLFSNGTVVPAEDLTLPKHALFLEKCGCSFKVICGYSSDNFKNCRYFEPSCSVGAPQPATTEIPRECNLPQRPACPVGQQCEVRPVCPPAVCPPVVCPSIVCPPAVCPPVVCSPVVCRPEPICRPEPCEIEKENCPFFVSKRKVCDATPCGKKYCEISSIKTFVISAKAKDNGMYLQVYTLKNSACKEMIDLKKPNLGCAPAALYEPRKLFHLRRLIEKEHGECVCLYIDDCNKIYAKVGNYIYLVCEKSRGRRSRVSLKRVRSEELKHLIKRGLYGVEFDC